MNTTTESPIDSLYSTAIDEIWDKEASTTAAEKLATLFDSANVSEGVRADIDAVVGDEAFAQCKAGFTAGFRAAMRLVLETAGAHA